MYSGNGSFSSTNPYANVPVHLCSNLSWSISISQPLLTPRGKTLFYCYYVKCFIYCESFTWVLYYDVAESYYEANACRGIMVKHIRQKNQNMARSGEKPVMLFQERKKLLRQFSVWTAVHDCHIKQSCQGNICSFCRTPSIPQSITNGLPCLGGTSWWPLDCASLKCRHHFCRWHIVRMQMPH